jgi:hypothetical protein
MTNTTFNSNINQSIDEQNPTFSSSFHTNSVIRQFSERNLSSEKWQFKNTKDKNWLTATVPGQFIWI